MSSPDLGRRAIVLGCAGQDGSYLAEQLVGLGYEVVGVVRGGTYQHLSAVRDRVTLHQLDIRDTRALTYLVAQLQPDELYNCAAVSFGPDAWADPVTTAEVGTVALAGLLDAVRDHSPRTRLFHSSSSWVFGQALSAPQDERTPYRASDPYGATKAYGDFLLRAYRERYGLYLASGILFNHESPRRSERFVTRKITAAAARIAAGSGELLELGDISALRDWGYAADYMDCAWRSLQADEPRDYVIGTGTLHSVSEVLRVSFDRVGLDWGDHVRFDSGLVRSSADVPALVADASRARELLGWTPTLAFEDLVELMVDADVSAIQSR
jgi:GDPmannose 4,6-dehydratase